jgi:hypothetical protein
MEAYEAASAAGGSSRRHSSASVAAAGASMCHSSGLDHELSIGWRDCRRSSSAQHSNGLQQVWCCASGPLPNPRVHGPLAARYT